MRYFVNIFVLIIIGTCAAPLDNAWFHRTDEKNIVNYFNSLPEKKVCDIWTSSWNQQEGRNSDIRKYQSKLLQSEYIINDKKESLELDTSILINNYKIYQSQLESSLVQIEANKILLDVLTKEYESGIKTFTDLIDQEEQLLEAYLYNFSKNKDLLITYFQILAIEGKLVEVFKDYLPKL